MAIPNSEYWAQRTKRMENALQNKSLDYANNLETQFNSAAKEIDNKIRAWYQRFAVNNKISFSEAQKLLTKGELKEFKWTVWEYIEKAKESAISGEWAKELENASARVHISRLEALKIQLRQQAEELAGVRIAVTKKAAENAYIGSYYHTAFEIQKGLGVACTMEALNKSAVEKILSRPWTTDNRTFTARCWTDKNKLVQLVNQELTRMAATGASPDKAIETIAKQLGVSAREAARVVMTESAAFATAAQRDCFNDLDVEQYQIVGTFDKKKTCNLCGDLNGKVFPMSEFREGETAPPFHPWCRCCTAPYFADMEGIGRRWSRNPDTGKGELLPADTKFSDWKARFVKPEGSEKGLTKGGESDIMKMGSDGVELGVLDKPIKLRVNLFDKSDPIYFDALSIEEEDGFEDICIHGSPSSVQKLIDGKPFNFTAKEFAEFLKSNKSYKGGNIRLASCSTGKGDNSFAQQLSKELSVTVKAPDDDVYYIPDDGVLFVGSPYSNVGKWRVFKNGDEIV